MLEALEPRQMLYLGPMIVNPTPVAAMENPGDTVFRIVTNLGYFDIETFDSTAPNTVNNFRQYVNSGKIDETFFHSQSGTTLRAGAYRFTDGSGLSTPAALAPVANEFSRLNLERTISMAKPAGQPNGATNIFNINLVDNPALDSLDGGYTVFGKIIAGWNVVLAIASLNKVDLDFALTGSDPDPGTFDLVPVTAQYNPNVGPTEATIVKILDIDATKPVSNGNPYINAYVYTDGLRTATSVERIDIVNMETNFFAAFQVIVHYATGDRDAVIATGALSPGRRFTLKTNDTNLPNYNLVRSNVGYAIEVRSTRALGVSFYHRDNNVQLGETFVMEPRFTEGALRNWNFGGSEKGAGFLNTISWLGLKDQVTTVNVGLFPEVGNPKYISFTLKPFRRGELRVENLGATFPDGKFAVQVSATGPIIAALTKYKQGGGGGLSEGSTTQGGINQGGTVGFLAAARVPSTGESAFDIIFTAGSPSAIIVDFTFIMQDGSTLLSNPVLLGGSVRRAHLDLTQMGVVLPTDTNFSVRYAVRNNAAPVSVNYSSDQGGDLITTAFQTWTTRTVVFADGFYDPTVGGTQEVYSILNPYAASANVTFFYQVKFHFSDGTTLWWNEVDGLGAWGRVDIEPQNSQAVSGQGQTVLQKINSNSSFRFYSVEIITAQFTLGITGGVIAEQTRLQSANQSMATTPGLDTRLTVLPMSHPEFN